MLNLYGEYGVYSPATCPLPGPNVAMPAGCIGGP